MSQNSNLERTATTSAIVAQRTPGTAFARRIALSLSAAAILAGAAAPAQAHHTTAKADTAEMVASIQSQLTGNAFGWSYAIAQNGQLNRTSAPQSAGFAVSAADTGGSNVGSNPSRRMQLMSATKTFTAISTMKLLRANGLTIWSPVAPYLPSYWPRGNGFKLDDGNPIRFYHLLSHTSGFNQYLSSLPQGSFPAGNGWDLLQFLVEKGAQPGSQRSYKNANFAMLGLLNAELWKRSGGAITVPVYDPKKGYTTKTLAVDKSTMGAYKLSHMRKHIFEPLGIENVSCKPTDSIYEMRGYGPFATTASKGSLLVTSDEECAGHVGLRLSVIEMVRVLTQLRHGTLVHPDDRLVMDFYMLGWDDRTTSFGVFSHGGDAISTTGGPEVHTCNITFPDGTEAAIIVNSPLVNGAAYQCTILRTAWQAAQ